MTTPQQPAAQTVPLGEDDGYVRFTFADGTEVQVDLWAANDSLYDYHQANKDKPFTDYNAGLVELMGRFGFPPVSHRMACRWAKEVQRLVDEAKKKPGSTVA